MVTYAIADDASEPDYMEAKELFELPVVTVRLFWIITAELRFTLNCIRGSVNLEFTTDILH